MTWTKINWQCLRYAPPHSTYPTLCNISPLVFVVRHVRSLHYSWMQVLRSNAMAAAQFYIDIPRTNVLYSLLRDITIDGSQWNNSVTSHINLSHKIPLSMLVYKTPKDTYNSIYASVWLESILLVFNVYVLYELLRILFVIANGPLISIIKEFFNKFL